MTLLAVAVCLVPIMVTHEPAFAQAGSVDELHRTFAEVARTDMNHVDPEATVRLGLWYLQEYDRDRGCGLLYLAAMNDVFQHPGIDSDVEALLDDRCTAAERDMASAWLNCWEFGPRYPIAIAIDTGRWAGLTARSVVIQTPAHRVERERSVACYGYTVSLHHVRVDPPGGVALPPRHFVQSFVWESMREGARPIRELHWVLEEVTSTEWKQAGFERLVREPGSAWPIPGIADRWRNIRLRMETDGRITVWVSGKKRATID